MGKKIPGAASALISLPRRKNFSYPIIYSYIGKTLSIEFLVPPEKVLMERKFPDHLAERIYCISLEITILLTEY